MSSPATRSSPTRESPLVLADVGRDLGVRFVVDGSVQADRRSDPPQRAAHRHRNRRQSVGRPVRSRHRGGVCRPGRDEPGNRQGARRASLGSGERADGTPADRQSRSLRLLTCARSRRRAPAGATDLRRGACALREGGGTRPHFRRGLRRRRTRSASMSGAAAFDDIVQSALARKRAYEKASRRWNSIRTFHRPTPFSAIMQVIDRRYEDAITSAERAVALGPGDAETQIAARHTSSCSPAIMPRRPPPSRRR